MALSLLIWPIAVMAQDSRPPSQANPPVQSPAGENNSTPPSDTSTAQSLVPPTAPIPSPAPILLAQPAGSFYVRPMTQPPVAPGHFTELNLGAGYSVTDLSMPSTGHIALSGVDVSFTANGGKRIGAKLNLSYALAPNVSNTGHRADVFSYLVGPMISLWNRNLLSISAHVLGGGARVSGPFQTAAGGLSIGHVHYPAWAFGGSVEHGISPAFGLRVTIDCIHAHFFNAAGAVRGQYDIRVVNAIVYYLGEPIRPRHRE